MDIDEEVVIVSLILAEEEEKIRKRKQRFWIHNINRKRLSFGEFHTLFPDLIEDDVKFFQYFRMTHDKFECLLNLLEGELFREKTKFRSPVQPKERLAICVRFLATGMSYRSLAFSFRMGLTTIREIVHTTCEALWRILQPLVMPEPTECMWKEIEKGFCTRWNFPNAVGALDGKHVVIQAPDNSGADYFCYKKCFSIVLLALVDAEKKFIFVDVGGYGKNSDASIFNSSELGKKLQDGTLNLPSAKKLPGTDVFLPHVIIGDEAFPLRTNIMRPYSRDDVHGKIEEKIYNYRTSRCGTDSPCEQLCYELHDGMFECDCKEGFLLSKNGYSCLELNTTMEPMLLQEAEVDVGEDILYQKDASFSAELDTGTENEAEEASSTSTSTSVSASVSSAVPSTFTSTTVQAVQFVTSSPPPSDVTASSCTLECAAGGQCTMEAGVHRCQCPLGRTGQTCESEVEVRSPRFSGQGWLAFPALRAAYKHVQLQVEFRPESWDGILFLTGERDDLAGDFMVLFLYQGFVEFRFDCGSGVGMVRSEDNVLLNQWNKLTLYRHRWDAWIQLNNGKRVQGRSKGLFSRITFREPVFIGGRGNTSGISEKLPTERGFRGCVRHLEINDLIYNFALAPAGDAVKGFDIEECVADRCSKVPCQHGGKCLTSGDSAVCLCPLGFTGDLCETRLDLQVPSFNGSSYLRYPGLGGTALSWLDLLLVFKPSASDGVILYNGHRTDGVGDFMSVYMSEGHLEFTFDLGTGAATLRSEAPVTLGQWHELRVSRTGRLAVLQVDKRPPSQVLAPGAFTQLSLPLNLYIGGVPNFDMVSPKVKVRTSFVGCIQKVVINNQPLHILAEALAGVNVDNCPHPCVARPCGEHAHCVPHHEAYKCQCERHCQEVNAITTSSTASFTGTTFLHYTDPDIVHRIVSDKVSISLRFRTSATSGLLLWSGGGEQARGGGDFLALGLADGLIHMRYNLGSGEALLVLNSSRVNDGHWHRLKATRNGQEGWLSVDNSETAYIRAPGKLKQLNTYTGLYVGGLEDMEATTHHKYHRGLKGCISDLVLDSDYHVKLSWSSDTADHCG